MVCVDKRTTEVGASERIARTLTIKGKGVENEVRAFRISKSWIDMDFLDH